MGDFNFHIKDLGKRLNKEGLKESIPEGVVTHTRGNQLDQIFSNVETVSWETSQLSQTDHKLIQVKLKIKYQESDLKLSDRERTIRISDVRKQCWKTFIEEGREMTEEDLNQPIQKCFEDKIGKQFKRRNWYQQPPEWAIKCNGTAAGNVIQDTKTKWKDAMRDLEQCLERNDVRGFFYLVKRLTKSQKQAQSIKGLTIKDERTEIGDHTKEQVLKYYRELFRDNREQKERDRNKKDTVMIDEQDKENLCDEADVEKSIQECNFNKAIGPDGFDGKMLNKSKTISKTVTKKINQWLNEGHIPQYIKEGRLILLSKEQKESYPEVNNTRPIKKQQSTQQMRKKVGYQKLVITKMDLKKTKAHTQTQLECWSTQRTPKRANRERPTYQWTYRRRMTQSGKTN
ncbi:hypothetical protein OXYTRIMIC_806 [Oxytricha trifallax]|uniref:Endonuclease/exonuclease/phosphatase domain-containing protein n=1 Tax=Oxytricha trifallax TaxID=1172189 RepID=A0A073HWP3_9SPIT|nr:hypothetical protein OXYTRIMIC_806 [Oxytricha trifallax]